MNAPATVKDWCKKWNQKAYLLGEPVQRECHFSLPQTCLMHVSLFFCIQQLSLASAEKEGSKSECATFSIGLSHLGH